MCKTTMCSIINIIYNFILLNHIYSSICIIYEVYMGYVRILCMVYMSCYCLSIFPYLQYVVHMIYKWFPMCAYASIICIVHMNYHCLSVWGRHKFIYMHVCVNHNDIFSTHDSLSTYVYVRLWYIHWIHEHVNNINCIE